MKLTFLPTLSDMHEMLGDKLYIEFVWMWREQEQQARIAERRARWTELLPVRQSRSWPQPLVARIETQPEVTGEPLPAQIAVLQRFLEQKSTGEREALLPENVDFESRREAVGGKGR
jgi:hypothetical protein